MKLWRDIRCLGCGHTITLPFPIREKTSPKERSPKEPQHLAILCPRCDRGYDYKLSDFLLYPRECTTLTERAAS
jgi:hypothetical protein